MKDNRKNKQILCVAITGSIGSGKSTATHWFESQGYRVFCADTIGHNLLNTSSIKKEITKQFGMQITTNGNIDRKKLAKLVFSSNDNLKILNTILHPKIIHHIEYLLETAKNSPDFSSERLVFFEIPLLFEAGIEPLFDLSINVSASIDTRLKRLTNRDTLSKEEVMLRMRNQLSDDIKTQKADITIENETSIEDLYNKLRLFLQNICVKGCQINEH